MAHQLLWDMPAKKLGLVEPDCHKINKNGENKKFRI